jgi:alpha/beta superfamily hydrolase
MSLIKHNNKFEAGLDGVTFTLVTHLRLGGFYKAAGLGPRPTAILIHGLPGIEKHLDIAYRLRDLGWNCLYFHFRGSWGSGGNYSIAGLTVDTNEAINWVVNQPSVDKERIVLIGGSTGSYPALLQGGVDPRVRAIIGISPLIDPRAFKFSKDMAESFAKMMSGITGKELIKQWNEMQSLQDSIQRFMPRPIFLITADNDDIFPPAHYLEVITKFPAIEWLRKEDSDHGFSMCRTWLVETVVNWLISKKI